MQNREGMMTNKKNKDDALFFTNHKLFFHADRMEEMRKTGTTFPIAFDVDLTNLCNHKCPQCNGSMEDGKMDTTHHNFDNLKKFISDIAEMGARAIGLGGGGDPSMYPQLAEALKHIRSCGLDIGLYTNGSALKDEQIKAIVQYCTWVRVSLDADGPELYEQVHGIPGYNYQKVLDNIKRMVDLRKSLNSKVTLSTCYLIGPHTIDGIYKATQISRELGVDYVRLRPYFQRKNDESTRLEIDKSIAALEKCATLETENFKVFYPNYRIQWMDDDNRIRNYKKCYGIHFTSSVDAHGNVFPCCQFKCLPQTRMGNINENSFKEIWNKESRKNISENIDFSMCPNPCNLEKLNEIIWDFVEENISVEEYMKRKGIALPDPKSLHKNFL